MDNDVEIEIDAAMVQAGSDRELSGEVLSERVITLSGKDFRCADKVGLMPLLKFSHASSLRTDDERAYAAMYSILRDVIYEGDEPCGRCAGCKTVADPTARDCNTADPGDWEKFEEHATKCKADAEELLGVVSQAIKLITARPTELPSSSSSTRRRTSRNSTASKSQLPAGGSSGSRRGRRAT